MSVDVPQRVCIVVPRSASSAIPAGVPAPAPSEPSYETIARAVSAGGIRCIRVDLPENGAPVGIPTLERLCIADLVVADVTIPSPDVMYMIGVRHGDGSRPTVLISAEGGRLGARAGGGVSDVITYGTLDDGSFDPDDAARFENALAQRVRDALGSNEPHGIPLIDATRWATGSRLEHDKTDVFLERIARTTDIGQRIRGARVMSDRAASVEALRQLERELLERAPETADLVTGLLGVYLAYRERKAYRHMVDLYGHMPQELKATPVAREQLALALNRLAESGDADPDGREADVLRTDALAALDTLGDRSATAETWAIRGRIHKGAFRAASAAGDEAGALDQLDLAIESYERAVDIDMRDYFPGINAVTLRAMRGTPQDTAALNRLVPIVRMAVDNAPPAHSEQERYWQTATKLELSCAAKDWQAADEHLGTARDLDVDDWMHETTICNLELYRTLFARDAVAVSHLNDLIAHLRH